MVSKPRLLERIQKKQASGHPLSRSERRQLRKAGGEAPSTGYQILGQRGKERASQRAKDLLSGISISGGRRR